MANCWTLFQALYVYHLDYIVLENLTGKFKYPCVMDLKIGTRSYSDAMSEAKKQLHLERCDSTTSKAIGVRLGGMQVYMYFNC